METIIRIYDRERLLEAKLQSGETCTIGKAAGCTIQIAAACLGKKTITVKTDADSWSVSGAGFRQEKLPYEKSLVLDPDAHLALTAYPCRTKAAVPVPLTGTERLTIGRNADCDIQIADQQISGKHTALFYQDGRWRFQDLKSRNGTYLNMRLAGSGVLADGDVLSIGFCQLRVSGDRLFVWSSKAVRVKPAAAPEKRTAVSPDDPYPFCFKPSPRLLEETPCKTLELQAPPTIGGKPNVSWLNILLAPLLSVIVMVAVCLLVTNVMTMLYFSVPTTIIGVVVSILRYRGEKKKYRSQQQLRLDTYSTYLQEQVRELEALRSEQQTVLAHMSPSTDVCIRRAATGSCGGGSPATRIFFPCALAAERSRQASRFRRRNRCCGWKATSSRSSRRRSRSGSPWFRTARSAFRWVSICPAALWESARAASRLGKI